jgi:hypothetical protein
MADYDNNIVNGPDLLSESQGPMQQNFEAISDLIDVNHVGFNDPDQGKHKFVTFRRNTNRGQSTANDKIINSQNYPFTNTSELLFGNFPGVSGFVQTARDVSFSQPLWAVFSDKGLVIKTMTVAAVNGAARLIFPTGPGIPPFSNIQNVQLCIFSPAFGANNGNAYIKSFDILGVDLLVFSNVAGNTNPFGFQVIAIGSIGPTF